jgi:hypothetical protein
MRGISRLAERNVSFSKRNLLHGVSDFVTGRLRGPYRVRIVVLYSVMGQPTALAVALARHKAVSRGSDEAACMYAA